MTYVKKREKEDPMTKPKRKAKILEPITKKMKPSSKIIM